MKRQSLYHVWLCALTGVTLLLAGCFPRRGVDSQAVTAAVNAVSTRYSSSLNAGDLDSWLSLLTDDEVQLPPGEPPVVGKDQIRARNKGLLDKFTVSLSVTNAEVGVADDWAAWARPL
jgi:ketosteroid isomerase-like protein